MLLHSFSLFKRTQIFVYNKESKKNKSTISGKMGTFLENLSFFTFFCYPPLFEILMFFSMLCHTQSLYEKMI